jgi:cis-3-alkyl-4-acyloxetan-2-one decarboxylase
MSSDWRELFPFESHFLPIRDNFNYHYLDEGHGRPLLLVHGNPTWAFYWREMVKAFRDRYRVVVPDHLGCGLSSRPKLSEYSFNLADRVADLVELVERLDLQDVTLIAHDWGGAVAMGAAVERPDRFGRFVLMNTGAFLSKDIPTSIHAVHIPILGRLMTQGLNIFVEAALRWTVEKPERMTPQVRAGYRAPYDSWANRLAVHQFAMDIPLKPSHPSYATLKRIEEGLPQFRDKPISFFWGMKDFCFTPKFLDRFLEFYPEAEVHRYDDVGHYVMEDAHERVIPEVEDFLNRTMDNS